MRREPRTSVRGIPSHQDTARPRKEKSRNEEWKTYLRSPTLPSTLWNRIRPTATPSRQRSPRERSRKPKFPQSILAISRRSSEVRLQRLAIDGRTLALRHLDSKRLYALDAGVTFTCGVLGEVDVVGCLPFGEAAVLEDGELVGCAVCGGGWEVIAAVGAGCWVETAGEERVVGAVGEGARGEGELLASFEGRGVGEGRAEGCGC